MNDFPFAVAQEYGLYFAGEENRDPLGNNFRWGTLVGDVSYSAHYQQWSVPALVINTVHNEEERNGQFRQFLTRMMAFCTAQNLSLVALNVTPPSLATYLIEKWHFRKVPPCTGVSMVLRIGRASAAQVLSGLKYTSVSLNKLK